MTDPLEALRDGVALSGSIGRLDEVTTRDRSLVQGGPATAEGMTEALNQKVNDLTAEIEDRTRKVEATKLLIEARSSRQPTETAIQWSLDEERAKEAAALKAGKVSAAIAARVAADAAQKILDEYRAEFALPEQAIEALDVDAEEALIAALISERLGYGAVLYDADELAAAVGRYNDARLEARERLVAGNTASALQTMSDIKAKATFDEYQRQQEIEAKRDRQAALAAKAVPKPRRASTDRSAAALEAIAGRGHINPVRAGMHSGPVFLEPLDPR